MTTMAQHYSNPKRANDEHALPDVETFYIQPDGTQHNDDCPVYSGDDCYGMGCLTQGWYWQSCFPGCLPDGEPNGPFATEEEAVEDAQSGSDDDDLLPKGGDV